MEVESAPVRQNYSKIELVQHSNCLLVFCGVVSFFCFAVCLAVGMVTGGKMAGFWLYLFILLLVGGLICCSVVGWQIHILLLEHKQKLLDIELKNQDIELRQRFITAADSAERNNDNYKMVASDKSFTIEVVRQATQLEHARIQYATRVVHQAQSAALSSPAAQQSTEEEKPIPIPQAPSFWDIVDLITEDRMPLCFVVDVNPRSKTFMQTIPAFGTILDLLSLCVIGRPGRGKSVFLLYYLCILAKYGSEVHILDPQGAFKELMMLHRKVLPAMPATARIYYYSKISEMEQVVSNMMGDIAERERYYEPHMEGGRFVPGGSVKHPVVIMVDELPIIAEMDIEIKQRIKEENRARKEEGLEALKIRQVTSMIKTAVLAARKYNVYFIGVSQSIDATILPTRVTSGFNSRIIFSSTLRKATMAGLESEDGKRLLPVIKRAGPGKAIYECGRWDDPLVAAFPNMTVADVLAYFGISMDELEALWIAELTGQTVQTVRRTTPLSLPAVQSKTTRKATLQDAITVWNEQETEIGRGRLPELLQARDLQCSDDLAKTFIKSIKQRLDSTGGAGGENLSSNLSVDDETPPTPPTQQ
jgi:hypothetical protein